MSNSVVVPLPDPDALTTSMLTASRVLVGVSARSLAAVEDRVTLTQFRLLVVLEGHGPSGLNKLAERLGVGPSTALRSVDRLMAAGMVTRRENDRDRREVVISLTEEGHSLVANVTRSRRSTIETIVAKMAPQRRKDLVLALAAFAVAAGEPQAVTDAATLLGW